jgi:hypothetical protein
VVPFLIRLALGGVFLAAGLLKIGHAADLAASIAAFRIGLPPPLVAIIALALPPFEILLGIYLVIGLGLRYSALVAGFVLALFAGVVASLVVRHIPAPCGCFGPHDTQPASWLTVLRDAALLTCALYLVWWSWASRRHGA